MTSEVKFLHAFIQGNVQTSHDLLPSIDLLKLDNSGHSIAFFCLWAAQQAEEQVKKVFSKFYPDAPVANVATPVQRQAIVKSLIVPSVQKDLIAFLGMLGINHVAPTLRVDEQNCYFITLTDDALNALLELVPATDPHKKVLINQLKNKLEPFVEEARQVAGLTERVAPFTPSFSIKHLMATLGQPVGNISEHRIPPSQKSFLPCATRKQNSGCREQFNNITVTKGEIKNRFRPY